MIKSLKRYLFDIWFCVGLIWKAAPRAFCLTLLFKGIETSGTVADIFVTKYLINMIIHSIGNREGIRYIILLILVYSLYNMLYRFIESYSRNIAGLITTELIAYLNVSVMRKAVNLDYEYFDMPEKFNEFQRNQNSVASLGNIVFSVIDLIGSMAMFLSMLACCLSFSVLWTAAAIAVLVPNYVFSVRYGRRGYELEKFQYRREMERGYLFSLFFTKSESQELRYGNAIDNVIDRYQGLFRELLDEKEAYTVKGKIAGFLCNIPSLCLLPVLSIYVVVKISKGLLSMGDFTYATQSYGNLGSSLARVMNGISSVCQYDERIKDFRAYYEHVDKDKVQEGRDIGKIESIEFVDVSFRYPGREEYVLKNLSLRFGTKEKVAIVGLNGSGKTTIFKLICGFYKPETGKILFNGSSMETYNIEKLRRHMAVLFQEYMIYSLPICENVAVSNLEGRFEEEKIKEALEMAGFHNAVYDKQKNINLYVGKEFSGDGIVLSGGQRQKLAIARAFYRKADVIMLDEPSAALDAASEYQMLKNLDCVYNDKLRIMITHKLYNTRHMDKIYCIEKGCVAESGTHDELMRLKGRYYEMFTVQSREEQCD